MSKPGVSMKCPACGSTAQVSLEGMFFIPDEDITKMECVCGCGCCWTRVFTESEIYVHVIPEAVTNQEEE